MKRKSALVTVLLLIIYVSAFSQEPMNYLEMDFTPRRTFKNHDGEKMGKSDYYQYRMMINTPISTKLNKDSLPVIWTGTVNGMYAYMNNRGFAEDYCPEQVVNLSYNVTHVRPLSKRWTMMLSLGIGVFAEPKKMSWSSIMANGAAIFAYSIMPNLQVGIGAALTTSYGVPMIMPTPFVKWSARSGKYDIVLAPTEQYVTRRFGDKFKLTLVATSLDGMSAVFKDNGKTRIYSNMRMRSYLRPELKLGKKSVIYADIGAVFFQNIQVSKRSYKGFFDSFKKKNRYGYGPTFNFVVGYKYAF